MEPVDYLKILQRHWKVAVGLILVVVAVVYVVSPGEPKRVYEAQHTLLRDQASANEDTVSADNPAVVGLWATRGEVPARVKATLGYEGPVDDLLSTVTVTPDIELGTVELTASESDSDDAVRIVNAFADELLGLIDERDAEAAAQAQAEIDQLSQRIRELAPVAAGVDQNAVTAQAQVEQANARIAEIQNESSPTEWVSLQRATSAQAESDSVVGATRTQRMLLAGLVAVLLAFGVAIMLDRSDTRLHTKEQAERQLGLPVLAEVPLLSIRARHKAAVHGYESDRRVAEAYRSLRTTLLLFRDRLPLEVEAAELSSQLHGRSGPPGSSSRQVIVIASPEAGDGKSSTAANLAMAFAEAGQSVLLVQWDLWRPIPARVLGARDAPGVSEFLAADHGSLAGYVQSTTVDGLHLMPAGELGHQPGAHLDAELRLLEEARRMADIVIIDTAPLLAASVTRELVTIADVVVLTCRVGRTTSPAAERAAELLERLGAPTLGVVLVGVPKGPFNGYYGSPPSRTDRLRQSVLGRSEVEGDGAESRYPSPRSPHMAEDDHTRSRSSDTLPGRRIGS
jgi:capsular exopolysaccharide synthesis family protein